MVGSAIDRPPRGRAAGVAASRRTRDRIVVLVEYGELIVERRSHRVRSRKAVILQAQMVDELRTCAVAASLQVRAIAVDVILCETPDIDISLQRPGVRQRVFAVEGDEAHLVVGRLRRREDRSVVQLEKLYRSGGGYPER